MKKAKKKAKGVSAARWRRHNPKVNYLLQQEPITDIKRMMELSNTTIQWYGPVRGEGECSSYFTWKTVCGRYFVAKIAPRLSGGQSYFTAYYVELVEQFHGGKDNREWATDKTPLFLKIARSIQTVIGAGNYPIEYKTLRKAMQVCEFWHAKRFKVEAATNIEEVTQKAENAGLAQLTTNYVPSKHADSSYDAGQEPPSKGKGGGTRISLFGFPVTAVIRWMGKDAWDYQDTKKALDKLQVQVAEATIRAQLRAGVKGERGEPAKLSKADVQELYNALEK